MPFTDLFVKRPVLAIVVNLVYLSFSSPELDQNQITDYLIRVVHPRLSAISGVQRADILADRTFAMRIWIKPDRMTAHGISPSMLREAHATTTCRRSGGPKVRWCR
jgi:multidrug efflux pump subunit AcrB